MTEHDETSSAPGPCAGSVGAARRDVLGAAVVGLGSLALASCREDGASTAPSSRAPGGADARPHPRRASWDVASGPRRQSGVTTPAGTHAHWIALDLPDDATADDLRRALVVLDDAARRFVTGSVPLPDVARELAAPAGEIAICVGVGPRVFTLPGIDSEPPPGFAPIPHMPIDAFEEPWKQTDLIIQIDAGNPLTVSHVATQLVLTLKGVATPRWQQRGFHAGARPTDRGVTRNLFGQLDGQEQPNVAGNKADRVWHRAADTPALDQSTCMVIRRIRMDVDVWQSLDRQAQENAIGRRLTDGSPLTGGGPSATVDVTAKDDLGFTVINPAAHTARARPARTGERILRRPYNYEVARDDGTSDRGLVFVAFCADIAEQFVPIQRRLAEADLLNTWTTPIGSAVYVVPPAPRPGRFVGQELVRA